MYRGIFVLWTRPLMGTLKRLQKERQELLEEKAKLVDLVRNKVSLSDLLQDTAPPTDFRLSSAIFAHINKVLEIAGYDKTEGSRLLGVSSKKLCMLITQLKQEGYSFPIMIDRVTLNRSNPRQTEKNQ
jgi:hypothetical protein